LLFYSFWHGLWKNSTRPSSTAQQRAAQSSEIGPACSTDARVVPPRPQPGPGPAKPPARTLPPGPEAGPINAGRSSEINGHLRVSGDQKRAAASAPESLIPFSSSLSLSHPREQQSAAKSLKRTRHRGWRLRRGTPRRRTREAGAARGTVERHHGGAL